MESPSRSTPGLIDPEALYHDLSLPEGRESRPYVVTNRISTAGGKATIVGRSLPIGSPLNRLPMRRIRVAPQGILVGPGHCGPRTSIRAFHLISKRGGPQGATGQCPRGFCDKHPDTRPIAPDIRSSARVLVRTL